MLCYVVLCTSNLSSPLGLDSVLNNVISITCAKFCSFYLDMKTKF